MSFLPTLKYWQIVIKKIYLYEKNIAIKTKIAIVSPVRYYMETKLDQSFRKWETKANYQW